MTAPAGPDAASAEQRRYSAVVVDGVAQAPSRAMLRAVGFTDADFAKPQVGIASTWSNLTPWQAPTVVPRRVATYTNIRPM